MELALQRFIDRRDSLRRGQHIGRTHEAALGEVALLIGRMVEEDVPGWGEAAPLIAQSGAIEQICGLSGPHVAPRPRLHALWALANVSKFVLVAVPRLVASPKGADGLTGLQRVVNVLANDDVEMLSRLQCARALVNVARYPMAKYAYEMHAAGVFRVIARIQMGSSRFSSMMNSHRDEWPVPSSSIVPSNVSSGVPSVALLVRDALAPRRMARVANNLAA